MMSGRILLAAVGMTLMGVKRYGKGSRSIPPQQEAVQPKLYDWELRVYYRGGDKFAEEFESAIVQMLDGNIRSTDGYLFYHDYAWRLELNKRLGIPPHMVESAEIRVFGETGRGKKATHDDPNYISFRFKSTKPNLWQELSDHAKLSASILNDILHQAPGQYAQNTYNNALRTQLFKLITPSQLDNLKEYFEQFTIFRTDNEWEYEYQPDDQFGIVKVDLLPHKNYKIIPQSKVREK